MEQDARAAGGEHDFAGETRDRIGLGGEGEGVDSMGSGGPALVDGEGKAGEAGARATAFMRSAPSVPPPRGGP